MPKDSSYGVIPIRNSGADREYLLIQHLAGHWGFPKGHAEGGESAPEAARREFSEETGIRDFQMRERSILTENYECEKRAKRIRKTVHYFVAFVKNQTVSIQQEEVQDYRWVSFAEGLKLITFVEGRKLLKAAEKLINCGLDDE